MHAAHRPDLNQAQAAVDAANESDTLREAHSVPGSDPNDINIGDRFVFLKEEATSKMRSNKRKVRYLFEGEEQQEEIRSERVRLLI